MKKEIRRLQLEDTHAVTHMQTNIEDDYVRQSFQDLVTGPNILYGLFADNELASIGGYSIYAEQLAMLGRLRSDVRFHGHGFATELMAYIRDAAFQNPNLNWIGANTQKQNKPTRRVLEKIGFTPCTSVYGALTYDLSRMQAHHKPWKRIHRLEQKRHWLEQTYLSGRSYFPYECYYLFPSVPGLFSDEVIAQWAFYENPEQTRYMIVKPDNKGQIILQVSYPWHDVMSQAGLWETISLSQQHLQAQQGEDILIWMDLAEQAVNVLPEDHPFELPSPWILYGINRTDYNQTLI